MANKVSGTKTKTSEMFTPPPVPPLVSAKEGYIKVRLSFLTKRPKHIRNLILDAVYGIKSPYNEDVCILLPAEKVLTSVENYKDCFEFLQSCGVLHPEDILLEPTILVEDDVTLAYVLN